MKVPLSARYILRWIERHDRREFTQRNVHQHGRRRFSKVEEIISALKTLEQRGYIRSMPSGKTGRGRPSSPGFEVNPAFFANKNSEQRTQNTQNSVEQPKTGNSVNIGSAVEQSENTNRETVTI